MMAMMTSFSRKLINGGVHNSRGEFRAWRRDSTGETDQMINVSAEDYLYGTITNGIVTVTAHSSTQTGKVLLGRGNSNGNGLDNGRYGQQVNQCPRNMAQYARLGFRPEIDDGG